MSTFEMDGAMLFAQLADKVARGELLITHFVMNLQPDFDKRYDIAIKGEMFSVQSARTKVDAKITAVPNVGRISKPTTVTMPAQVRELIFDEEPVPIYDEDLI